MGIIKIAKSDVNIMELAAKEYKDAYDAAVQAGTGDEWIFKFLNSYWQMIADARKNGKNLVAFGAGLPPELIYAFDAVPLWMDATAIRYSTMPQCDEFIDLAERHVPPTLCTIDRAMIGGVISGMLEKPDAMIRPTGPCDSFRQAYGICADTWEIDDMVVDQPILIDQRGVDYVADQYYKVLKRMEEITGTKYNEDKMREVIHRSNQAAALLISIAEQRKIQPCPMPGIFLALNEYNTCTYGTQALVDFLLEEYKLGQANIAANKGVTKGKEKHRILILQNMVWNMSEFLPWLEEATDSVVVSGTFEGVYSNIIDETDTDSMLKGLAARGFQMPMVHLAGAYAKDWVEDAVRQAKNYNCDCAMFLGHVGCKHTWAAAKMVGDELMKKCGIKTLEIDVDSVDRRYQKLEDFQDALADFLDTV